MSPIYLNPQTSSPIPFLELKGDQQHNNFQAFGHVHDHDLATTSTNSCLSYNNSHNSQEMLSFDYSRNAYSKVEKLVVSHEKTSDLSQPYASWLQSTVGDNSGCTYDYSFHLHQGVEKIENNDDDDVRNNKYDDDDDHDHHHDIKYSKKWKPSKVRIMQKMMTSSFKNSGNTKQLDHLPKQQRQNNGDGIRVCSDCHTTTTPLWRSGPQGPKSLCNACGIRQRKARRAAMAAAAAAGFDNDAAAITPPPTPSPRVEARKSANKAQDQIMKQERGLQYHDKTHTLPIKKRSKLIDATRNNKNNYTQNSYNNNNNNNNNNNYNYNYNNNNEEEEEEKKGYYYEEEMAMSTNKDYYAKPNNPKRGSFPRDEEEGAILLMALSCGLACSS